MNYFSIYNYLPNLKNNDIINKQVTMNNEKQLFLDMINKSTDYPIRFIHCQKLLELFVLSLDYQ